MKPIDGHAFLDECRKLDMEYTSQASVVESLECLMQQQPTIGVAQKKSQRYLLLRKNGTEEILIMPCESGKWSYINMTNECINHKEFEDPEVAMNYACMDREAKAAYRIL